MNDKTHLLKPSDQFQGISYITYMLKFEWWSDFEAALLLTEPPSELQQHHFSYQPIEGQLDSIRSIYAIPTLLFKMEEFNGEFQKIYKFLRESYIYSRFQKKAYIVDSDIHYFVKPLEIILWAIENGYTLRKDLQEVLSINSIKQKQRNPWKEKIKDVIIAQCHLRVFPKHSLSEIISGELMKKYGRKYKNENENDNKKLERDLRKTIPKDLKGKVLFQPLPEVLNINGDYTTCDFLLLKTFIQTATLLISFELIGKERTQAMNQEEFMKFMKSDDIIYPYLRNAPKIIKLFIEDTINFVHFVLDESRDKLSNHVPNKSKAEMCYKPTIFSNSRT